MKLVRYGDRGSERPGLWIDRPEGAVILDVRGMAFDIADYDSFFFARHGIERVAALARENRRKEIPAASVRLGPPVARPGKIICVGKNYADHAIEFDAQIPSSPILFSKASTSLAGPFDDIPISKDATTTDAESELALVIGTRARHVPAARALDYIAGFSIINDVTDRAAQKEGQQWFRGKSFDGFCPMGPWLITRDSFDLARGARVTGYHNQTLMQDGHTSKMIFSIPLLIEFISRNMTLEPGDIVATGTPSGVGFARNPPVFLREGDRTDCEIQGIGRISNLIAKG